MTWHDIRCRSTRMLIPRKLIGIVGWWRHVAPGRRDMSSTRIVGRSMWAIGAGGQEARLLLALTMACKVWYYITVCCCCFGFRIFVWIS